MEKHHNLVKLFATYKHSNYTLLIVRRQKWKRLETTGFIFNNVF